jgi:hypothetical protein
LGVQLAGLGRKLFEAEAGFAFKAPRSFAAVQASEAGLQPGEGMLDLRFRLLDRHAFSPAMSPNCSKHGCQMQRFVTQMLIQPKGGPNGLDPPELVPAADKFHLREIE